MTQGKAQEAARLLSSIHHLECVIDCLKEEREAKLTGLDYRSPGPQRHILDTIERRWALLGKWCVDFFITAMDAAIKNVENELSGLREQLEEL